MEKKYVCTLIIGILCVNTVVNSQIQSKNVSLNNEYFTNPIFAGDFPDPSILRDGEDFYIVHSSFVYYPGLLIWHSKDLINWKPVTHALHKYVGSVFAPDLVKHKGKYFIYFPANGKNYVISAPTIKGPWSDPIDLKIGGIDPGHIVANDGSCYLYTSDGYCVPLSEDGLSTTGPQKKVYDGWPIPTEWSIECFCLEGPKLSKVGEYFYMLSAEGGTAGPATSHMVVASRSKSVLGPWENSPYNPIIHTTNSSEKWWSKGHGTLIEDVKGKWWLVFHGYEKGYYNMGRQTLLQPVEWTADGWFKSPQGLKTDEPIRKPAGVQLNAKPNLSDDFSTKELKYQWQFFNEYDSSRFKLENNSITMNAKGNIVGSSAPMLCMPGNHSYNAQVEIITENDAMGVLALFYNTSAYAGIGADKNDIQWILNSTQSPILRNKIDRHVFLRFENIENHVNFFYSLDGQKWEKISNSFESSSFNHNAFGGFLSLRIGLCAVGKGKVTFKFFKYTAIK
ncbi:MAG: family 43 glycosylhydrolase [Bacteroidales bacterium]|nr:family 43 glycosylhydrolase [Bacteroidales bacterium]